MAVLLHRSGDGLYVAELLIGLPLAVYSAVRVMEWVVAGRPKAEPLKDVAQVNGVPSAGREECEGLGQNAK